ncbi:nuclear transport factor 2 family protein [Streptosporangiaceae bacterium NEAU-GS5]|nr:nuclear transport factor 2 family protein [Streptosporangiaceae bacterium NEAU-GS5]
MPAFPRDELDEMVRRWLEANRRCEELGDWRPLAELYTEDATYGWNIGPDQDFMAVGRSEIRDFALGSEMGGLDGWSYPYQSILIDERAGEVVGFWKQIADARRPDGGAYEVAGIGGSWFRYGGGFQWSWQRDWFDLGNVTSLFVEMLKAGTLSDGMRRRLDRVASGEPIPGYYPRSQTPVPLW